MVFARDLIGAEARRGATPTDILTFAYTLKFLVGNRRRETAAQHGGERKSSIGSHKPDSDGALPSPATIKAL